MVKQVPGGSPNMYMRMADAVYQSEPAKYLRAKLPSVGQVKRVTIEGWHVSLFKDNSTGELCVAFEGTSGLSHLFKDVVNQIKDPEKTLKKMGKQVDKWEKKYGPINAFVGHSEGGFFATHVKKAADVWRVTFNGHQCEGGTKTLNLRLSRDLVSQAPFSTKGRYIDIGPGGHGVDNFKSLIDGDTEWGELADEFYSRPPAKVPSQEPKPSNNSAPTQDIDDIVDELDEAQKPKDQAPDLDEEAAASSNKKEHEGAASSGVKSRPSLMNGVVSAGVSYGATQVVGSFASGLYFYFWPKKGDKQKTLSTVVVDSTKEGMAVGALASVLQFSTNALRVTSRQSEIVAGGVAMYPKVRDYMYPPEGAKVQTISELVSDIAFAGVESAVVGVAAASALGPFAPVGVVGYSLVKGVFTPKEKKESEASFR